MSLIVISRTLFKNSSFTHGDSTTVKEAMGDPKNHGMDFLCINVFIGYCFSPCKLYVDPGGISHMYRYVELTPKKVPFWTV